ncbi:MAG: hypothetical protein WDZ35_00310 [Crocinitomicaceae bacterium]
MRFFILFFGFCFSLLACSPSSQEEEAGQIMEYTDNPGIEEEDRIDSAKAVEGKKNEADILVFGTKIGDYQQQGIMVLNWYPKDENGIYPIDGYYFYVKHQKNLTLEGYSEPASRKIYLTESYKGKETGYIVFIQDDQNAESYWAPGKENTKDKQPFQAEELYLDQPLSSAPLIEHSHYTYDHPITVYNGNEGWDTTQVTDQLYLSRINDDYLAFDLSVTRYNAHIGSVFGVAKINGDTAIFESDEYGEHCLLTFDLSIANEIKITEDNCGAYHGANAYFDGTYVQK